MKQVIYFTVRDDNVTLTSLKEKKNVIYSLFYERCLICFTLLLFFYIRVYIHLFIMEVYS